MLNTFRLSDGQKLTTFRQSGTEFFQTSLVDRKDIPVFVGDLIKVRHFVAANWRKVYMYKRVMIINDRLYAVDTQELGMIPTDQCHKCLVEDFDGFEVIDGPSVDHPVTRELICFWERKKLPKNLPSQCQGAIWIGR